MTCDSPYKCPNCTRALKTHLSGDDVILFCTHRECEFKDVNDGEKGGTAWEAYQKFVAQYELWNENRNL